MIIEMEKKTLYKNVLVLSISFMMNFTAYTTVQTLQSSINIDAGLGTTGLSVLYGTLIFSNLFLPKFCIEKFGCNNTIVFGYIGYAAFAAANLYATWWTIILGAFICGLFGGPLWGAQPTYLTQIARAYSLDSGEPCDGLVKRLFGIFYAIFGLCSIGGNVVGSLILYTDLNSTSIPESELDKCGSEFCPAAYNTTNSNLSRPPQETIQLLMGILIALHVVSAIMVICGLDKLKYDTNKSNRPTKHLTNGENEPLLRGSTDIVKQNQAKEYHKSFEHISGHFKVKSQNNNDEVQLVWNSDDGISSYPHDALKEEKGTGSKGENGIICKDASTDTNQTDNTSKSWSKRLRPDTLIGTVQIMLNLKMLLLIPLSALHGFDVSYLSAEFPQAFVGCSQGIWMIGYMTMVTGCTMVVFSLAISKFKLIGRTGDILLGISCFGAGLVISLLWQSLERAEYLIYLIAIFNGACNACLQIGLNSTVGVLFMDKNEVAFSSLKVWQSIAITVTFIYSPFLCMDIKVYIMFGVLAVGTVCAIILEVICRREQRSTYKTF